MIRMLVHIVSSFSLAVTIWGKLDCGTVVGRPVRPDENEGMCFEGLSTRVLDGDPGSPAGRFPLGACLGVPALKNRAADC